MNAEMFWLSLVTAFTAVMWIPYVLDRIAVRGLVDTVGYPEHPKPMAPWAERMKAAHANAVENLVVFAALVLIAQATGALNSVTAAACVIYFWARVAHFLVYALRIPWLRTLAFAVGWGAQIAVAWQIWAH